MRFLAAVLAGYLAVGCRAPGRDHVPVHEVPVTVRVRHDLRDIDGTTKIRGACDQPVDVEAYWILLDDSLEGDLVERVALHELGHALLGTDYPHSDDPACALHAPTPSLSPCPVETARALSRPRGVVYLVALDCPPRFADAAHRAMGTWNRAAGRAVFIEAR